MNGVFTSGAAPIAAAAPPGDRLPPLVEPPGRPHGLGPGAGGGEGSGGGVVNAKTYEELKGANVDSQKIADLIALHIGGAKRALPDRGLTVVPAGPQLEPIAKDAAQRVSCLEAPRPALPEIPPELEELARRHGFQR